MMSVPYNCSASEFVIPPPQRIFTDARWAFVTFIYVAFLFCAVVFFGVFYWGKEIRQYERLRARRMVLVFIPFLVLVIHAQIGPGYVMFGISNVPCWLRSLLTMMVTPLIAVNIVLRLMIFFFLSELSREMTQLQRDEMPDDNESNVLKRFIRGAYDIVYAIYALISPRHKALGRTRVITALTFVASTKGTFVIFLIILAPFVVVALVLGLSDPTYLNCYGCKLSMNEITEIIVVGLLFISFGMFAAYRVRHFPDPWGLRREARLMVGCSAITLLGFVLGSFAEPSQDSAYDHQLVIGIGMIGFMACQTVYQVYVAHKNEKGNAQARRAVRQKRLERKNQPNRKKRSVAESMVNSTGTHPQPASPLAARLLIRVVLENPTLSVAFEKFLVSELGVESLMFLRDTAEWKKSYFDIAATARFARAKKLYNTYISPNGAFPVNIPHRLTMVIKNNIMKEGLTDCPDDVFEEARDEICDLLQVGALMRFHASSMYKEYLENNALDMIQPGSPETVS